MSKKASSNLIVGLDIGTSKVVAIVGEVTVEGDIEIIGIGTQPSRGLKKGVAGLCIGGGEATAIALELL